MPWKDISVRFDHDSSMSKKVNLENEPGFVESVREGRMDRRYLEREIHLEGKVVRCLRIIEKRDFELSTSKSNGVLKEACWNRGSKGDDELPYFTENHI